MAHHRIAVIGGDGIGPEVIDQAVRAVDAAGKKHGATFEWNRLPWGSALYKKAGHILPPDGWDTLDWITAQPWSNGKVATYGCSSSAENQLKLAAQNHPAHRA